MAQIIRASHLGFCFGVRDALQSARDIAQPERAAVYGELVHNQDVVQSLRERDFELISELDRDTVPQRPLVMITAHGISGRRRQSLLEAGKQIIDTTCPLVLRVHDAATDLAQRGYYVIVIGSRKHVEVLGVTEDLPEGRWDVVGNPDNVREYEADKIGIVCQTTMPEEIARQCRDRITAKNPHASVCWINTVCRPTRQRMEAIDQLCRRATVVIVVGGKNSNNTRRLAERCRELGRLAYHIQTAADIDPQWIEGHDQIGLTAGTSTPDHTIDAVEKRLQQLSGCNQAGVRTHACSTWSNHDWAAYFQRNLADSPPVPWSATPTLTPQQRESIAASVQTFQLGESGEGTHILACAKNWVRRSGTSSYYRALELFLREENRHADWLRRFLEQERLPLKQKQWSDGCFRFLRHLAGLRTCISVLVTAEILAQVYYLALLRASDSPTLKAICKRILRDERAHVVFQQNQLEVLSANWSAPRRWLVSALESVLFLIARRILWHDHRPVFDAAGMDWTSYRKRTLRRWNAARRSSRQPASKTDPVNHPIRLAELTR